MKLCLFSILLLFFVSTTGFSQEIQWKDYFPEEEVDSLVFLSTNKGGTKDLSIKERKKLSKSTLESIDILNKKISDCFHSEEFPLNDFSNYLDVYELKSNTAEKSEILKIIQLFPKKNCNTYPISRCSPDYRDCIIFFKNGKPISAIKMCFGCKAVRSTPHTEEAYCLSAHLKKIVAEWINRGLVDLFERE